MSDVALRFAKEIMGWEQAYRTYAGGGTISHHPTRAGTFKYNDIRQLIKIVKLYCAKTGVRIDMNCLYGEKPCIALMQACLDMKELMDKAHG